jgi:hypothetical protein
VDNLISARNIKNYIGCKEIVIKKGMIITPSARDIAKELGIRIIYEDKNEFKIKSENPQKTGELLTPPISSISKDNSTNMSYDEKFLEALIEKITREIVGSNKKTVPTHPASSEKAHLILMINLESDINTERDILKYILESEYAFWGLTTSNLGGYTFINAILKGLIKEEEREELASIIGKKFNVHVLISFAQ